MAQRDPYYHYLPAEEVMNTFNRLSDSEIDRLLRRREDAIQRGMVPGLMMEVSPASPVPVAYTGPEYRRTDLTPYSQGHPSATAVAQVSPSAEYGPRFNYRNTDLPQGIPSVSGWATSEENREAPTRKSTTSWETWSSPDRPAERRDEHDYSRGGRDDYGA